MDDRKGCAPGRLVGIFFGDLNQLGIPDHIFLDMG